MSFSDKYLKRLKEKNGNAECWNAFNWAHSGMLSMATSDIDNLLARLEAAEKVCRQDERHVPDDPDIAAWRKACGR